MNKKKETSGRILDAAILLMGKKGYHPVTIREIATAVGLSEMTIFRHFPSKYDMLSAAMRRSSHAEMFGELFSTAVRWDLEYDLRMIMEHYFDVAEQRRSILQIYFSALAQVDEHDAKLNNDAIAFHNNLQKYFEEMSRRGHMRSMDVVYASATFWHLILGYFVSRILLKSRTYPLDREIYITNAISIVIRGIANNSQEFAQ